LRRCIAAPRRRRASARGGRRCRPPAGNPAAGGWPFILLAAAFSLYSFILSGVTSNLLALLERGGLSAATAVTIGAMFGPAQVASRLADFMSAGCIARGAVVLVASAFAMLAFAVETLSDRTVLQLGTFGALVVLGCFLAIRPPGVATRR
jgi:hypothetical protein